MSDTPRMDKAAGEPRNWENTAEDCYEEGCRLERENAKLREALQGMLDSPTALQSTSEVLLANEYERRCKARTALREASQT